MVQIHIVIYRGRVVELKIAVLLSRLAEIPPYRLKDS